MEAGLCVFPHTAPQGHLSVPEIVPGVNTGGGSGLRGATSLGGSSLRGPGEPPPTMREATRSSASQQGGRRSTLLWA